MIGYAEKAASQSYMPEHEAPPVGLHSEISGNVSLQFSLASDARKGLLAIRDRIFGAMPELADVAATKTLAPVGFAGHIREGHDMLTSTLHSINEIVSELSNRL